jgi:hypothetical protein
LRRRRFRLRRGRSDGGQDRLQLSDDVFIAVLASRDNPYQRQASSSKRVVNKSVSLAAIIALMRSVVEFYGEHRLHGRGFADDEVDMLG